MKLKVILLSIITLGIISIFALTSYFIFSPTEILPSYSESTTEKEIDSISATESAAKCIKDNISDQIIVINPQPNQLIHSPLIVEGEAKGTWFFEATFPIKLLDSNGNIIAIHYAEAQGEWMTEDLVAFIAQIEFEKPQTDTGVLILEKDNPSGLPEKDATFIHVRFKQPEKNIEGANTQEEYFTGAILKSIDIENNMIIVEQLIKDPDEIIIKPQVMLSEDYRVVKSILDIEAGEEKSIDIALTDIPLRSEIGILFNKEDAAELIIYQILE